MLSDAHVHFYGVPEEDVKRAVSRAEDMGVKLMLAAGADLETSIKTVNIAGMYDSVYACVGVHPWYADTLTDGVYERLGTLAKERKVVAIGEIGLDFVARRESVRGPPIFVKEFLPKEIQMESFVDQIKLAKEAKLPVIVHENGSHSDILEVLRSEGALEVSGVIHGFIGDVETAEKYLDLGFYISIGKRAIWMVALEPDRASALRKVIEEIPPEKLLIETDTNEPAEVRDTAQKIAEVRRTDVEEIGSLTTSNLKRLLKL